MGNVKDFDEIFSELCIVFFNDHAIVQYHKPRILRRYDGYLFIRKDLKEELVCCDHTIVNGCVG